MFIAETPAALQEQILKMMLAAPEATAVGAMNAMFDPAIRWSDVIKSPALTVYAGTANVPDPAATKELYPNHEATQVAGTGHFLMMEKPEEFNRLLGRVPRQDQLLSARLLAPGVDRLALHRVGAHLHDLDRHAVDVGDPRDLSLRDADRRVGDVTPRARRFATLAARSSVSMPTCRMPAG